ncbi:DUF2309 domain-containing protein [Methylomonas methanica]|uniref:Probable inorganic carbon transporter subunit DabA n=1 Tax=Methylomonas methanica (strain DSM 25384 / MC09) TaxID=857087 RepID=G0A338_METMM|nr:DUF2309 domain-containing protein [Methylomonas methanica]AEF98970.1 UPF0753 protein [Methylomonas methanica MC09]
MNTPAQNPKRQIVLDAIRHLDHVLPGQAPIHDFVHHNTLHGFQHLPFEQALAEFTALTGIDCYLPEAQFRQFHAQGRISDADIDAALNDYLADAGPVAASNGSDNAPTRRQFYRQALLSDLSPLNPAQLTWQLQESDLLQQPDARALWETVLDRLELTLPELHPEQLLDLSREQAETWLSNAGVSLPSARKDLELQAVRGLFDQVGDSLTLRGLLLALTGTDILENVRPRLIKLCASVLDEGQAAWRLPQRQTLGLYKAWRQTLPHDAEALFQDLTDWPQLVDALPEAAGDAIVQQLEMAGIPCERWAGYLERLALELPGWSGLLNWRQTHPDYSAEGQSQTLLADYLAIRLILDQACLQAFAKATWRCPMHIGKLQAYFEKNNAEVAVRHAVFGGQLPEYLQQAGQSLVADNPRDNRPWQVLTERIHTWQHSPLAGQTGGIHANTQGWQLFRLCRDLGLRAAELSQLPKAQLLNWLTLIEAFTPSHRQRVWLDAYERHYQQDLLQALHANHNRGRWAQRRQAPQAQIVFCMDDREEGIRRHLEELNPAVETLGAAGFFGVPMHYQGLDDAHATPLCPVVVTPSHTVREQSRPERALLLKRHKRRNSIKLALGRLIFHGLRRGVLSSAPLIGIAAPFTLAGLLLKSFTPKQQQRLLQQAGHTLGAQVETHLQFQAEHPAVPATPQNPRLGFTDSEQAERIAAFLKNTGLTYGFAEIVVLMGHGSMSQNNPHLAAYDCGACSGRHGGPNARLFAAMANRAEIRQLLLEHNIDIPEHTWFIGAEHNTCDEDITWYDSADIPAARLPAFQRFVAEMEHAQRMSAHERCRRLASAPRKPTPAQALRHFLNRAADFSQARPELGHATNAAALVGRRSLTQGAFFDRRLFLISYDPTQDPEGTILEGILLAVGPVGAGINLEYYFSTVNNERLGCGSKVPHNLTGFCAVMEGAGSDLRTGLPKQMIEIHEAMRLQIVVEAKTTVLEKIYNRQESLRELIGGGWVHLSSKDPDSGEIFVFRRASGFMPWQAADKPLPLRDNSPDCYREETLPVAPMLIKQPSFSGEPG